MQSWWNNARRNRVLAPVVITLALGVASVASFSCSDDSSPPNGPTPQPQPQPQPPAGPRLRMIVVTHTQGFRHSSITVAEPTLQQLGDQSGLYEVVFCRTEADVKRMLTPDGLRDAHAVFFANTTGNLGIPDMAAFLAWIRDGHAFLGAHSASDTYHDEPGYLDMLGNQFAGHGNQTEVDAIVENPTHPAVAHLGPRYRVFDEIYRFVGNNRGRVDLLLSLDRAPNDGSPDAGQPVDFPLAWSREYGMGRVFYTALGHREEVWQDARFRQHLLGAIRWALRR